MAKALAGNHTLEEFNMPTRACLGIQKDKQVVMHQLAVAIAKHPALRGDFFLCQLILSNCNFCLGFCLGFLCFSARAVYQ